MTTQGTERIVVVGYGPAAHRLVERLAHFGHRGEITVLGGEPEPAYQRPLLTSVVDGTLPSAALRLPAAPEGVRLLLGVTATAVDRVRRLVHCDDGRSRPYDRLVLATGATPALPALPTLGELPSHVRVLRTIDDAAGLTGADPVAVVGGGPLAVEAVLALRRLGRDVTLVHRGPYPLDRHLDPRAGELLADRLRALDVDLCLGRTGRSYEDGKLRLDDGRQVAAHDLLLCTGVTPRDGLARSAGLAVDSADGGVLVDDELRTDDPRVHAIGDCARPGGSYGSYDGYGGYTAAWEQAEALAVLLTGGSERPARSRPVLRLRARELDLLRLGSPADADETVILSDAARGRYARLSLKDNQLCGAVLLGFDRAIAAVVRLYQRGEPVPADRLALLLGAAPEYAGEGLPGDVVVCHCSNVTGTDLESAWRGGARTPAALTAATRASTGCGSCGDELRRWCAEFARREEAVSA